MRPSELKQTISALQNALTDNEQINLAFFARKLAKTAEKYPEDQTIGQISLVINRMNQGNKLSIARSEIKDLYKRLYSSSTKFAQLFVEELGEAPVAGPTLFPRSEQKELDFTAILDQDLLAGLNASFNPETLPFSTSLANAAEKVVASECSFLKMVPEVKSVSGDENCVVVSASYSTPKGKAIFWVPVEIINKKATIPSIFIGKTGSKNISKQNIASYITDFFSIESSFGDVKKYAEVKSPIVKDNEIEKFADKYGSEQGIAASNFGNKVEYGRKIISQKMKSFGKHSHQISVLDSDNKSITYGVSSGNLAFKVPVKIEANLLHEPSILICKGSIQSFTEEGLKELDKLALVDHKVAATVSPLFNLKASDLLEKVRESVREANYTKAEDALNILANSGDTKAYKTAFMEYSNGLAGVAKTSEHSCSRIVKSSTSTQPLCGHLNLPLDKVYQDKHGHCSPLYRKSMEETSEGFNSQNSKIFQ